MLPLSFKCLLKIQQIKQVPATKLDHLTESHSFSSANYLHQHKNHWCVIQTL